MTCGPKVFFVGPQVADGQPSHGMHTMIVTGVGGVAQPLTSGDFRLSASPHKRSPLLPTSTATPLPCRCHDIAMSLPCHCHVIAMPLPCHCHATPMSLPTPCHCHGIAVPLPCHCHVIAMTLPCHCHVMAMSLPCHCHVIAMSTPMTWQWHGNGMGDNMAMTWQ